MHRFRLKSATVAVQDRGRGKDIAFIPKGAEITADLPDVRSGFDRSKFIAIKWEGKTVSIFLLDLLERGERLGPSDPEVGHSRAAW
jgi:hypothetical protein